MKLLRNIILITILIFIIFGCAKAKSPFKPDEQVDESILVIANSTGSLTGYPRNLSVTNEHIFVAEDEAGFSMYNRETLEKMHQIMYQNGNVSGTETPLRVKNISVIADSNMIFVHSLTDADRILYFDYSNLDSLSFLGSGVGATSGLGTVNFIVNPVISEDEDIPFIMLSTAQNEFKRGYYQRSGSTIYLFPNIQKTSVVSNINSFTMDDEYFYLAGGQLGLYTISRDTFEIIGNADSPGDAEDITISGNYAYVADTQDGLQVFDCSDKSAPVLLSESSFDISGHSVTISSYGNYLVVGSGGGGVYLFNIEDKAKPVFVDNLTPSEVGYIRLVYIDENGLIAVSRDNGILKVDIKL